MYIKHTIAPETIVAESSDFSDFKKATDAMALENKVLIMIPSYFFSNVTNMIKRNLPGDSFIEHHEKARNNEKAKDWVKVHLCKTTAVKNKEKYMICDWHSAAGYEAPAVILVTKSLDDLRNATFCQRAQAKLIIYHVPMVKN